MLRSTGPRLTTISLVAAILVTALVAISSATAAAQRTHVLYRNFCPVNASQVQAAGPYVVAR